MNPVLEEHPSEEDMYKAMTDKDAAYEDIFVAGVKTTGVFCRPTCSAGHPKIEDIDFFAGAKQALDAGFRPCNHCHPMQIKGQTPAWVKEILTDVAKEPTRKWTDADVKESGINPNRLRRWFKKHHRITFHEYLRLQRLGHALGQIKHTKGTDHNALNHDYDSASGFREAMASLIGEPVPEKADATVIVYLNRIATPLGLMLAGTTQNGLCMLEFIDRRMLATQLKRLIKKLDCTFLPGSNAITDQTAVQLEHYFNGDLKEFTVPLILNGTDFREKVWRELQTIPYGHTRSYQQQAQGIGKPKAVRAVARANGDNRIAIIIPCHRVIGKDGNLTGYGGGLWRKRYLLNLEQMNY